MPQQGTNSDDLVRVSHLNLWIVLATVLCVGGAMLAVLLGGPDVAGMARTLMFMLPIGIALALGALRLKAGKANCMRSADMRAVLDDELRQQALAKGYRNGFFAAMSATVASAPILSISGVEKALPVMMVAVVTLAVAAMLGSVLYYDR
jgi:hypothetical protein